MVDPSPTTRARGSCCLHLDVVTGWHRGSRRTFFASSVCEACGNWGWGKANSVDEAIQRADVELATTICAPAGKLWGQEYLT